MSNTGRCILWLATCVLLLSCSQNSRNDEVVTIPLGASVDKENQQMDPAVLKVVDVTRIESAEGCYLSRTYFFDIDDESVGVYDGERIMRVGVGHGNILLNMSRVGRGPGEYLGVNDCRYDPDNKWYVVTSLLDGKTIWYDENGRLVKEKTFGDRGAFCPMMVAAMPMSSHIMRMRILKYMIQKTILSAGLCSDLKVYPLKCFISSRSIVLTDSPIFFRHFPTLSIMSLRRRIFHFLSLTKETRKFRMNIIPTFPPMI